MSFLLCNLVVIWILSRTILRTQSQVLLVFLLSWTLWWWQDKPRWQIVIFDIGHGLAVAIHDYRQVYLYDVGPSWPGGSIADQLILPWLQWYGFSEVKGLIVSHDDNDHAGGVSSVQKRLSIEAVIGSRWQESQRPCIEGQTFELAQIKMKVLWPKHQPQRAYNPHSCVVKVTDPASQFSILLSGDIDAVSEYLLSRQELNLKSNIVVVPHHGSRTSSTRAFIEQADPEVAISSNAYRGRWNLPNPAVVSRYTEQGAIWYDTGRDGMITIDIYDHSWQVNTTRRSTSHSWYRQMLRNGVE